MKFKTRYKILNDLQTSINSIQRGSFLPLSGGTLTGPLTGTDITAKTSLTVGSAKATYSATGLNFDKALLINNVAALKVGDYGIGGYAYQPPVFDLNNTAVYKNKGFYQIRKECTNQPYNGAIGINQKIVSYDGQFFCNLFFDYTNFGSIYYNSNRSGKNDWVKLITAANVSSYQGLGYGQTWHDVTNQRSKNVIYQNTTGKPIMVSVIPNLWNGGSDCSFYVGDVIVGSVAPSNQYTQKKTVSFIVTPGSSYKMIGSNVGITNWSELR